MSSKLKIAYFSMEICLESGIPTYSGGLGILAGDTVRSAADLKLPMVAVTLLHRKGYFFQRLDDAGKQTEESVSWIVENYLKEMPNRIQLSIAGRIVNIRAWRYEVTGVTGFIVPVFLLDTDLPENSEYDRSLTDHLYGGDHHYRLCQEIVLGIGGIRMLRNLGYYEIQRYHMNEGHASLLTIELLEERQKSKTEVLQEDDIEHVRQQCIFTTHTPVPAGHDKFPIDLVNHLLGKPEVFSLFKEALCCDGFVNMTSLALSMSKYINGVAKRHGEISRSMFPNYPIDSITNGVHAATWICSPFLQLYDKFMPAWKTDNFSLRYALNIPLKEIWSAHQQAKRLLIQYVNSETNIGMNKDIFTVGFARRATSYKRGDLLFFDIERLWNIGKHIGPLQIIYAGKAHPKDKNGKDLIMKIFKTKNILKNDIKFVYLKNYDMNLAKMIVSGVDLWLNTPQPPLEASGTSGMKAAVNGVPSLSILDGWWVEGHIEGITGWSIGEKDQQDLGNDNYADDAVSLYNKLENVIVPLFYNNKPGFIEIMRYSISLNGSFFNTQRMMQEYVLKAYF